MSATMTISDDLAALLAGVFNDSGTTAVAELPPAIAPPERVVDTSTTQEEPPRRRSGRAPYRENGYRGPRRRGYVQWQTVEQLTVTEANGKLEIQFPSKPSEQIRAMLKGASWRFVPFNGRWTHEANAAGRAVVESVRRMFN